jgi:hypothetical protein
VQSAWLIVPILSGILTFAFGLAWAIPMLQAGDRGRPADARDLHFGLLDLLLVLLDFLPIFGPLRALPRLPAAHAAAREVWRSDPAVRRFFRLSLASATIFAASLFLLAHLP